MPGLKPFFTFFAALHISLTLCAPTIADDVRCEFEILLDVNQRRFNSRVLNAMARHAAGQRSQVTTPRGKKATAFEDAVLEACRLNPRNPKLAAQKLGELLDVPPEVAEVAIAYYDLEHLYRDHPELREKVAEQVSEFFPLPDPSPRVPINGQAITDTWSAGLSRHSPAKAQFDGWRRGEVSSADCLAGEDDGLWWKGILTSVNGIEASQTKHPTSDVAEFLKQESGRLWQLYGALVERSLLKAQEGDVIPGPAITVGGKAHADGWKVRYQKVNGSPRLLIDGFLESKSSFLGVVDAQHQIRGFLTRLVENPNRIFVFGEYVDPKQIFLSTKSGPISLVEFAKAHQEWVKGDAVDAAFAEKFRELFPENFYEVAIPKDEPKPPLPVGRYAVTGATRGELQDQFARLVHKRFRPKSEEPNVIRDRLFAEGGARAELPPEWQHYRQFRRDGTTSQIVTIEAWMDPETGGLSAIKELPNYSTKLDESLRGLGSHLPKSTQQRLETEYGVKTYDGMSALSDSKPIRLAAERIRARLEALIQAHNEWVKESPQTRTAIPSENLGTKEGMERAIQILQKSAKPELIPLEDFITPVTGGITAIKELPSYSTKLDDSLRGLGSHLPKSMQQRLETEHAISGADGARALLSTQPSRVAAERVRARLEALIQAHNAWVKESPATRTPIPTENLATKEGMERAIKILKAASGN